MRAHAPLLGPGRGGAAFVLASFVQLLLAYLSLSAPEGAIKVAADMRRVPQIEHMPPFCCLSSWPMGPVFLTRTLIGVLQYSIAMPLITIISLVAWWNRLDGFGELSNFGRAYPYLAFVQVRPRAPQRRPASSPPAPKSRSERNC